MQTTRAGSKSERQSEYESRSLAHTLSVGCEYECESERKSSRAESADGAPSALRAARANGEERRRLP